MTIDQKDEETNTKTKGADRTVRTDGKNEKDRIGRTDKTNI